MYILQIKIKSIQTLINLKEKILEIKNKKKYKNVKIKGVLRIKNKKKIFTVLKSPHVNKKSREQFIYNNFIQKIDLEFLNIIQLLNFVILLKKTFSKNFLISIKIKKRNMLIA